MKKNSIWCSNCGNFNEFENKCFVYDVNVMKVTTHGELGFIRDQECWNSENQKSILMELNIEKELEMADFENGNRLN